MNSKPFRRCLPALMLACLAANVQAETCKYVDADGRVIYSNTPGNPPKGAKKVKCFDDLAPKPAATPAAAASKPGSATTNALPRVDEETQRKRDDERRRILERELDDEEQRLAQARQKLAEQEAVRYGDERNYQRYLDRVQPFRDTVANHERNVEAIKREISSLR